MRADAVEAVAEVAEGRTWALALLRRADDRRRGALKAHDHRRDAAIVALQAARLSVRRGRSRGRPRTHRQGPRRRGLARRHPAAVARGALRARAGPRAIVGTRATTSGPGSPTCTRGSRRSAASTSRAPSSGTAAPWRSRGSGSRSTEGSPALAYEWSERARALVGRVTPVRPPADERLAADCSPSCGCCTPPTRRRTLPTAAVSTSCATGSVSRAGTATGAARSASPRPSRRSRPSWPPPTPASWRTSRSTGGSPRSS